MAQVKTRVAVKFTRDYTVADEHKGTDKEQSYKKNQRVMLARSSAAHFVKRGVAVYAQQEDAQ